MNKIVKVFLSAVFIFTIVLVLAMIIADALGAFEGGGDPIEYANRILHINLPDDTSVIVDEYAGPSSSTGDGYSWSVLQVSQEEMDFFASRLAYNSHWQPLPISADLVQCEDNLQPKFVSGIEGEIPVSDATGYYFFTDNQEDSPEPFCERISYSYKFALFDDGDGKLYLWHIDT